MSLLPLPLLSQLICIVCAGTFAAKWNIGKSADDYAISIYLARDGQQIGSTLSVTVTAGAQSAAGSSVVVPSLDTTAGKSKSISILLRDSFGNYPS